MKLRISVLLSALSLVPWIGAAAPPSAVPPLSVVGSDAAFERLVEDAGGLAAFNRFLDSSSEQQIRERLERYGITYVDESSPFTLDSLVTKASNPDVITDCPTRFGPSLRNAFHDVGGMRVFIDAQGRPRRAFRTIPPITTAARDTACQSFVGNLGNNEPGPFPPYDGGHMVGTQLGGWGARANMVPQNLNFNRGNWLQVENGAASCRISPPGSILYTTDVFYENDATNVPYAFQLYMLFDPVPAWAFGGGQFIASWPNQPGGGTGGTNLRRQVVRQMVASGCGVGRVAMVVDDTGSMSEELSAVQASLRSFIDSGITIENRQWYLYSFKDDVTDRGNTSSRAEIKSRVDSLYASGGNDCPEQSLGALQAAAQALAAAPAGEPRDLILVTDAESQPGDVNALIAFAQANDIRINVLLTGTCGYTAAAASAPAGKAAKAVSFPSDTIIPAQQLYSALASETGGTYSFVTSGLQSDYEAALGRIFSSVSGSNGAAQKLNLTSICWPSNTSHKMRVRNPNSVPVAYTWDVYGTSLKGSGIADAGGDSFFTINGVTFGATTTVRIFWNDLNGASQSVTKATNQTRCP